MFPIIQVGPLAIQAPGLFLLVGIWLGLSLSERYSTQFGIDRKKLYNLVFLCLVGGVVGARLTYVIRYPNAFLANPINIFSLNTSLFDLFGGTATFLIVCLIYGQRNNLPFWPTLDSLTPALAVFSISIGLSHLSSGSAFGSPTLLPWGINLWGTTRHPTQVIEIIISAIILIILWPSREFVKQLNPGQYFLIFIVLSSLSILFIEAFRGDSTIIALGLRANQIIAWLVLALSIWQILIWQILKIEKSSTN
jgi:phosphatidylglycerol:prolipoprotein diacylglycerol transferase